MQLNAYTHMYRGSYGGGGGGPGMSPPKAISHPKNFQNQNEISTVIHNSNNSLQVTKLKQNTSIFLF